MKIMGLSMAALFVVLAFSATAASTASAFHPLFTTLSGKELLIAVLGNDPILRAKRGGITTSILCELVLVHLIALDKSTLAEKVLLSFNSKCVQKVGSGAGENCNQPIVAPLSLIELGLLSSTTKKVVFLLIPGTGTVLDEFECEGHKSTVSGALIGEFPENNAKGEKQLNIPRKEFEAKFESTGKNSNKQLYQEIFLLGTQMSGIKLSAAGFLEEEASLEAVWTMQNNHGPITISTQ